MRNIEIILREFDDDTRKQVSCILPFELFDGYSKSTISDILSLKIDEMIKELNTNNIKWSKLPEVNYEEGYAEGEHMTFDEFYGGISSGCITDDDGSGYWATDTRCSNMYVFENKRPEWATHVVWYNK